MCGTRAACGCDCGAGCAIPVGRVVDVADDAGEAVDDVGVVDEADEADVVQVGGGDPGLGVPVPSDLGKDDGDGLEGGWALDQGDFGL